MQAPVALFMSDSRRIRQTRRVARFHDVLETILLPRLMSPDDRSQPQQRNFAEYKDAHRFEEKHSNRYNSVLFSLIRDSTVKIIWLKIFDVKTIMFE